jgi:hypothetical protein
LLGIAWFYSSESGLFNGLRRIQIKISFRSVHRRRGGRFCEWKLSWHDILIFASIFAIARSPVTAVGCEDIEIGLTAGTKRKRTALARHDPA